MIFGAGRACVTRRQGTYIGSDSRRSSVQPNQSVPLFATPSPPLRGGLRGVVTVQPALAKVDQEGDLQGKVPQPVVGGGTALANGTSKGGDEGLNVS